MGDAAHTLFQQMKGPPEFHSYLLQTFTSLAKTESPDKAEELTYRKLQQAGWYKTAGGEWRKVGPDLSKKINFRQAIAQPDETYAVFDVDVFYPNAAKGAESDDIYTPERVNQATINTNRSVASGSQPPGLALGHPHPLRKILGDGKTSPVYGRAINWRSSPRGTGWVRCDIVKVDPEVMEDWTKGRYIGLSAGLVSDSGSNERFGHVALLGADMQQLSSLPMTEVSFSVPDSSQVCFSTDAVCLYRIQKHLNKGNAMFNPKNPAHAKAFDAMKKAFASFEAGEPGANKLYDSAKTEFDAAVASPEESASPAPKDGASAGGTDGAGGQNQDEALINEVMGKIDGGGQQPTPEGQKSYDADTHEVASAANPSEESAIPVEPELDVNEEPDNVITRPTTATSKSFSADDVIDHPVFQNLMAKLNRMERNFDATKELVQNQRQVNAALLGRQMIGDFRNFLAGLTNDGHQFDTSASMKMYAKIANDTEAVTSLKAMLLATPKSALTAGNGGNKEFSASGSGNGKIVRGGAPAVNLESAEEITKISRSLRKAMGKNFSAEEIAIGTVQLEDFASE